MKEIKFATRNGDRMTGIVWSPGPVVGSWWVTVPPAPRFILVRFIKGTAVEQ